MKIELNCDLGEGAGNDAKIMPLISACNIACGGHAGDKNSMIETLILAKKYGVKIGAHPAYPDKENFGRISVKMSQAELFESVYNQVIFLQEAATELGLALNHVKPHGALYNDAMKLPEMATVIVDVIKKINPKLTLLAPYDSALATCAEKEKMSVTYEAFIDRRYNKDLSLVSRQFKTAVIIDAEAVFDQFYKMVSQGKVTCFTGQTIEIKATTYCIHGDNVKAVSILKNLHKRCKEKNISIN